MDYLAWARTAVASSAKVKKITPRWVQGDFPDISQEHAKAAALRAMLPWVAGKALERAGDSEIAGLRSQVLNELVAMDAVCTRQPRFLSQEQERKMQAHSTAALGALAQLCRLQPHGPWRLVPKAHALWHIAQHSAMVNPRVTHCYQDEDFIGRVKRLYSACRGRSAPLRTVQRYSMGTAIRLTARQERIHGSRPPKAPRLQGGPQRSAGAAAAASAAVTAATTVDRPSGRTRGAGRGRGRPPILKAKRPVGRPPKARGGPAGAPEV